MKSLVFWGGGPMALARERQREGAVLLLWNEDGDEELRRAGIPFVAVSAHLDAAEADRIDEAAMAWTKAWGRRPLLDGRSFRDLFTWRGFSLWWFAELYLHHSTGATRCVRLIERFHRVLDAERPDEAEAVGLPVEEAVLLGRTCTSRGILFHGPRGMPVWKRAVRTLVTSLVSRWNTAKTLATAIKAGLAGPAPQPAIDRRTILFLSHAAFWKERRDPETDERQEYEHYFDRLIPEVASDRALAPYVVAVGPRAAFRRRGALDRLGEWLRLDPSRGVYVHINRFTTLRVFRETLRASREARALWRRLRGAPAVREAFSHRGVSFSDRSGPDLAGTLLLQLPWAVRSYEEMAAALGTIRPAVVCLYAESSGWGRAALLAGRAAGVPAVAIQHGILYPKYYSLRHEVDEADCPRPHRTAVFGEAARRLLGELGHYPDDSLVVTGSPKFDGLRQAARSWDRQALRQKLGVTAEEKLLLVASRFRGIRETHESIGSAFPAFVRATESFEGLRVLVKPHPAEPAEPYAAVLREVAATKVRVLPPAADLTQLLHACDALVTVESLSAVEALVLGRPVLVLNMPTNIRDLVEQGVALGVLRGEDPTAAVRALLFDPATHERLEAACARYLADAAAGVDGLATRRILDLLRGDGTDRRVEAGVGDRASGRAW